MKKYTILLFVFFIQFTFAQKPIQVTDSFRITGLVKQEKTIFLSEFEKYPIVELNDVNVSCSPKQEKRVSGIKAVLLKSILDSVSFQYEKSRMLNQYYFLFVASDGYKMVFSFNEIYNTEIGKNLFLVTKMEGKSINDMDNRILIITTKDIKGGSRNMKWLEKIIVCKAE
jgi:hypothetical protein